VEEPAAEFDFARLAEISGGDRDFELELTDEYVEQSRTLLEEYAGALQRRDTGAMARAAHTLKGSSRTIGAQAVAVLAAHLERLAGELVLLDFTMPGIDGHEVLTQMRHDPASANLPVIVAAAREDEGLEARLMNAGADDYIHKPLEPARFLARVKAALRRARV